MATDFGGTIIDACQGTWDTTRNTAFVLTASTLWKTTNLMAEETTYEAVYTNSDDAAFDGLGLAFVAVETAPGSSNQYVYLLGGAQVAVKTGQIDSWMFYSYDGGETFRKQKIGTAEDDDFGLTIATGQAFEMSNVASTISETCDGKVGGSLTVVGKRASALQNFVYIYRGYYTVTPVLTISSMKIQVEGTPMSTKYYDGSSEEGNEASRPQIFDGTHEGYESGTPATKADDGVYTYEGPFDMTRIAFHRAHLGTNNVSSSATYPYDWSWRITELNDIAGGPLCMAVSPEYPQQVFVGTKKAIWKTTNGGGTWIMHLSSHGASDIHVARDGMGGNIYFWSTVDGYLYKMLGNVIIGSQLYSDTIVKNSGSRGRIATRPGGAGTLYILTMDGKLLRNTTGGIGGAGSFSEVTTGLSGAKSLTWIESESLQKLYYVEGDQIHYSKDGGVSWFDKKGGWSISGGKKIVPLIGS